MSTCYRFEVKFWRWCLPEELEAFWVAAWDSAACLPNVQGALAGAAAEGKFLVRGAGKRSFWRLTLNIFH